MNEKKLDQETVIAIFSEYGVLNYLKDYFDVLHTQNKQWLIDDIEEFIYKPKKEIRMKIYHGSTVIVEKPEIRIPTRSLDYGFWILYYHVIYSSRGQGKTMP